MQKRIKVVNTTGIGKDTCIYLIGEDGSELDISTAFNGCIVRCDTKGVVTATLEAFIVETETTAEAFIPDDILERNKEQ